MEAPLTPLAGQALLRRIRAIFKPVRRHGRWSNLSKAERGSAHLAGEKGSLVAL